MPDRQHIATGTVGPGVAAALAVAGDAFWSVVSLAETTSTNDVARALAAAGAPEGTVVVADKQTSGRGRLGRAWHSPSGSGLWCSAVLRPPLPLGQLGPLALVVAIAVYRTGLRWRATGLGLKWPNDLVVDGRKVAGILTEAVGGNDTLPPDYLVVGIGVNVRRPADGFPPPLDQTAVALEDLVDSNCPTAGEFGAAMLTELAGVYRTFVADGFASLQTEWLLANITTGQQVEVSGFSRGWAGVAETIDGLGRLVVRCADGNVVAVAAGDVTLSRKGG